ncbi:type IV pilus modification protein PilV [Salinibius halmophilus]|uniref:type IV pilus modification protein PilV n=1 Tax=Salinibius halmophilus TaxID=1853216 RepID=UPI000E66CDC8|nr:type IV pilus modification protein PilV [Salinibius halmophilus]
MKRMKGFGLIEVMVALLVIAIGVMGLMSLQTYTLKEAKEAEYFARANFLAKDMFERIRANTQGATGYTVALNASVTTTADCNGNACTAAEMASWDLFNWCFELAKGFQTTTDDRASFTCNSLPASIDVTLDAAAAAAAVPFTRYQANITIEVPIYDDMAGSTDNMTFSFVSEI